MGDNVAQNIKNLYYINLIYKKIYDKNGFRSFKLNEFYLNQLHEVWFVAF